MTQITAEVVAEHGLSPEEYERVKRICGGRQPTWPELGIFSVMWSEHCSYKSSRVHLKRLPTKGERVLVGPGENAGVVDIGDGLAVCFKMESHNHPSFIEPYQGAATGVGGIMRDIFTMGARPIASLNSLRFGMPNQGRMRHLVEGVVAGIGGYGNCMGVPTVGGEVQFHPSYGGNILVNAFNLGSIKSDQIFLGQASGVGNPVIYAGARTGRDGIHGATMASDSFDDEALEKRPTVQVGDPFTEKCVLEACLEMFSEGLVEGIQDMGAAGLTCSTFEMADRAGTGIDLHLDTIPTRESGMTAYELLLSESQERMLLVCVPEHVERVHEIFAKWGLASVVCGKVTGNGRVRVQFKGENVVDLPASPLSEEAPVYDRPQAEPKDLAARLSLADIPLDSHDIRADLLTMVGGLNLSSRRFVYRQYDHMVRVGTRMGPGADAALIRVPGTGKALGMTVDCNSRYVWLDPHNGAAMAVAEGVRNLACVGAEPIGATDCLNFGNPEKPETMWEFSGAIDGIADACNALGVPIIGGNVSFYNETDDEGILPTPTLGIVGLREGISEETPNPSAVFTGHGHTIALLGTVAGQTLGGSEYLFTVKGVTRGAPPQCDLNAESAVSKLCRRLVCDGLVSSAHDLSEGGLLVALAESSGCHHGERIGATVELTTTESPTMALFGEAGARILISYPEGSEATVAAAAGQAGVPLTVLGKTGGDVLHVTVNDSAVMSRAGLGLKDLFTRWSTGLTNHLGITE
jgi:phosphoribosylformylglycinamidine synthase II